MFKQLSCALLLSLTFNSQAVEIGEEAPSFMLPMMDNKHLLTLKQYRGKVVYLDFWASWCGPCRQSLPEMNKLRNKLKNSGFEVLAINLDEDQSAATSFLEQYPVQYPVVKDVKNKTPELYKIPGMPTSYLIDKKGVVRDIHVGFKESDLTKIENKINELLKERS